MPSIKNLETWKLYNTLKPFITNIYQIRCLTSKKIIFFRRESTINQKFHGNQRFLESYSEKTPQLILQETNKLRHTSLPIPKVKRVKVAERLGWAVWQIRIQRLFMLLIGHSKGMHFRRFRISLPWNLSINLRNYCTWCDNSHIYPKECKQIIHQDRHVPQKMLKLETWRFTMKWLTIIFANPLTIQSLLAKGCAACKKISLKWWLSLPFYLTHNLLQKWERNFKLTNKLF